MTHAAAALEHLKQSGMYEDMLSDWERTKAAMSERDRGCRHAIEEVDTISTTLYGERKHSVPAFVEAFGDHARLCVQTMAEAYPEHRLELTATEHVATGTANAFALRAAADDTYAIGVDFSSIIVLGQAIAASLLCLLVPREERARALNQLAETVVDNGIVHVGGYRPPGFFARQQGLLVSTAPLDSLVKRMLLVGHWFIIAHELAHIALGHLAQGGAAYSWSWESTPGATCESARRREYEADEWAKEAVGRVTRPGDTVIAVTPEVAFRVISLVECVVPAPTEIGKRICSSHPSPASRADRLRPTRPPDAASEGGPVEMALWGLGDLLARLQRHDAFRALARAAQVALGGSAGHGQGQPGA